MPPHVASQPHPDAVPVVRATAHAEQAPIPRPPVLPPVVVRPSVHPTDVVNAQPWIPVEAAAYSQMAGQLTDALERYQRSCQSAAELMDVAHSLSDQVTSQLESAAWSTWRGKMAAAFALSGGIISDELENRGRNLTKEYGRMLAAVADALSEWHHWMDMARSAEEAIIKPAQRAYDDTMGAAYGTMMAAVHDATANWQRQFGGAKAAGALLADEVPPAGEPPKP